MINYPKKKRKKTPFLSFLDFNFFKLFRAKSKIIKIGVSFITETFEAPLFDINIGICGDSTESMRIGSVRYCLQGNHPTLRDVEKKYSSHRVFYVQEARRGHTTKALDKNKTEAHLDY